MKKFIPWLILIIFLLFLLSTFFFIFQTQTFKGRASSGAQTVSTKHSYVFTSPLEAQCGTSDKRESIRVTVYTLDEVGKGILGSNVSLESFEELIIKGEGTTDPYGMTYFDVTCKNPGEYYLKVTTDGNLTLPQKAHLVFK